MLRPRIFDSPATPPFVGTGWALVALVLALGASSAGAARFDPPYRVTLTNSMRGTLDGSDSKPVNIVGEAKVVFRERSASGEPGGKERSVRVYEKMDYTRSVGEAEFAFHLRERVRRVIIERDQGGETIYSPDAPLRMPEIDLIASQTAVGLLADLATQRASPGTAWVVAQAVAAELAGIARVESGQIEAADQGAVNQNGKLFRKLRVWGSVLGPTPDGRGRNNVEGEVLLDPGSQRVAQIRARGIRQILGMSDKPIGRFDVEYELKIDPLEADAELSDAWLDRIPRQVPEPLTEVEWEDARHGLVIRHARAWAEQISSSGDLILTKGTSSVAVHLENPGKVPSTDQYLAEAQRYLEGEKAAPRLARPKREVQSPAGRLGNFQFAATLDGKPTVLDYWVVERGERGVTIAGRLAVTDALVLSAELEAMARSAYFLPSAADSRR